jgi:glyoxylase-like metal-dependent hydrolase (beta-lactamase superfamily II)
MYELVKVTDRTFYIDCPAKMGLYVDDDGVILIDSGGDKDAGRKVIRHLEEWDWKLKAIINTHSNADHIGGNKILMDRLGVPAYTTRTEGAINEFPQLEPTLLYGGYPWKDLRHKQLMAKPTPFIDIDQFEMPKGMEYFRLPGHFIDMIGIKTPDDVYFMADCVSAPEILDKYHVGFIYDVKAYLETLDMIEGLKGRSFVPAHAPECPDMKELARVNREKVLEVAALVLDLCKEKKTPDQLIKSVFDHYGLAMNAAQYVLVGSTIRSYASYLADGGKLKCDFEDNAFGWTAV